MAGLTAPKLLWLQRHEPEVFKAIDCVLSPKDYLRLRLSGERVSEMSDAAGTLWLDVANRQWFSPMLRATGLAPEQMPRLVEGGAASACLTARELGLRAEVVIAGGGGDNPVAAVGIGRDQCRRRFHHVGHQRGDCRDHRPCGGQPGQRGTQLLPCAARPLVHHGRDAGRRQLFALGHAPDGHAG